MNQNNIFSDLPKLETERLILRKLTFEDAQDMFLYASDPEVARYVGWDAHKSLEDTMDYLRYMIGLYEQGEPSNWGMVLKQNNRLIGTCGYDWWVPNHSIAEMVYAMSREYWNKGLMTEAIREVIRFGFEVMKANRIEAQHIIHNESSGKVMQKAGMSFEAVLRQRAGKNGVYYDVKLYSILRSDFLKFSTLKVN